MKRNCALKMKVTKINKVKYLVRIELSVNGITRSACPLEADLICFFFLQLIFIFTESSRLFSCLPASPINLEYLKYASAYTIPHNKHNVCKQMCNNDEVKKAKLFFVVSLKVFGICIIISSSFFFGGGGRQHPLPLFDPPPYLIYQCENILYCSVNPHLE